MKKFILLLVLVGLMKADGRSGHGSDDSKILGGSPVTDMRKIPYIVSLSITGFEFGTCSGTIITPLWVVTACHCVAEEDNVRKGVIVSMTKRIPLARWTFIAGTAHLKNVDHAHVQYGRPVNVVHHPECKIAEVNGYSYNDLGLVKMKQPFKITPYVKPAKLLAMDQSKFLRQLRFFLQRSVSPASLPHCTVAGWGRTDKKSLAEALWGTRSPISTKAAPTEDRDQLKSSVQNLLGAEPCIFNMEQTIKKEVPDWFKFPEDLRNWRQDIRKKTKDQICIQSPSKNESACPGDSGGGVVCNEYLVGVVSWSYGCVGSTPTILQSLVPVFDWFKNHVCDIRTCEDVDSSHKDCYVPKKLRDECKTRVRTFRPPPKGFSSLSSALRMSNAWLLVPTLTSMA